MMALRQLGMMLAAFTMLLSACDELDNFRTDDDEVFYGKVIGSEGSGTSSFILQGFAAGTEMEVTFDPAAAALAGAVTDEPPPTVGTLRTYGCPPKADMCPEEDRTPGHFDGAALEPIASLAHDALGRYDFPGGGRLRNYIFGARFDAEDRPGERSRHAMVFVSLMDNDSVEARVIAPSVLDSDGETELEPPLFGVFVLGLHHL